MSKRKSHLHAVPDPPRPKRKKWKRPKGSLRLRPFKASLISLHKFEREFILRDIESFGDGAEWVSAAKLMAAHPGRYHLRNLIQALKRLRKDGDLNMARWTGLRLAASREYQSVAVVKAQEVAKRRRAS